MPGGKDTLAGHEGFNELHENRHRQDEHYNHGSVFLPASQIFSFIPIT
jgi:hypothetical protein